MTNTPQYVKTLAGHAGVLYVVAELNKRGIPAAPLPEGMPAKDIMIGRWGGDELAWVQVKAFHPNRADSWRLDEKDEAWVDARHNEFIVMVNLGRPSANEGPRYWIATLREMGEACRRNQHGPNNPERRFHHEEGKPNRLPVEWENRWQIFDQFRSDPT